MPEKHPQHESLVLLFSAMISDGEKYRKPDGPIRIEVDPEAKILPIRLANQTLYSLSVMGPRAAEAGYPALGQVLRDKYGPDITDAQANAVICLCRTLDLLDTAIDGQLSLLVQLDGHIGCSWHDECEALVFDGQQWSGRVPVRVSAGSLRTAIEKAWDAMQSTSWLDGEATPPAA